MFIAKNNDLIILADETKEALEEKLQFMVYTSIEETIDTYILVNGKYEKVDQALVIKKQEKQQENTTKAQQAIQDGYVVFKEAQFETNTQTCSDLTSTMLLMQAAGIETYNWLSRDDKVVTLTLEDFGTLGGLIATYKNTVWNTKYVAFKQQIEAATTIEEVEAIVIDYDVPEILEALEN